MAILTNADFTMIKKIIAQNTTAKAEFKAWGLSKPTWQTMFQAVEDWFVDGFTTTPTTSFKAEIETVTGACTNAQAKQAGHVWMGWRFRENP